MGKSEREILRLLGEIYASGLGERSWADTLMSISAACGLKHRAGAEMIGAHDVPSLISIEFGGERGPAERDEMELLELLTPHIANSWRISQRLAQASRIDDFNLLLLENAPWGVVALGQRGRVLSVNGPARRIVARGDGLHIARRGLHARRAADDRALQSEIELSLQAARGEGLYPGGTMAIGRPGEAVPYGIRVLPLRHVTGTLPEAVPFVAILIADLVQPQLPGREDLRVVFGLSPREAEAALMLARGLSLSEIADHLRIAPGTARTHLANAMAKAGAHSQAALIGMIRSLPGRNDERV